MIESEARYNTGKGSGERLGMPIPSYGEIESEMVQSRLSFKINILC